MIKKMLNKWGVALAIGLVMLGSANAQQRGYYDAPYTRYEADKATLGGGASVQQSYDQSQVTFEASDRTSVLANNGGSVTWNNVTGTFNKVGITLRFAIADGANNRDGDVTRNVDLSINGQYVTTLTLHSQWSWEHLWDNGNGNNNGISNRNYRMRFDEIRYRVDKSYNGPISIKLEAKGNGVYFDFIEVEDVPDAIPCPAGFKEYTGNGNDLQNFVDSNAKCYVPAGTFNIGRTLELNANDKVLRGAGPWYTTINFTSKTTNQGGLWSNFNANASDFALTTDQSSRSNAYKGLNGSWGQTSVIENVFADHFECGAWIANYNTGWGNATANGLTIRHCRLRNNYADGVNLCRGSHNCVVEHCSFRNNGDDDMAIWPADGQNCYNNTFQFNTAEHCYRASSCALYGGYGNKWQYIVVKDNYEVGIRIASTFAGYCFADGTANEMNNIDVIGCGTWNSIYGLVEGAIEITQSGYACGGVVKNVRLSCIDIKNSNSDAIQIRNENGGNSIQNVKLDGITIGGASKRGYTNNAGWGGACGVRFVDNPTMTNCTRGTFDFDSDAIENEDIAAYGSKWNNMTVDNFANCVKVAVEGVSITPATLELGIDESKTLTANVTPENAADKTVTWASANENVATVDASGKVTGVNPGTTTITVKTNDGGYTATATVTVKAIAVTGVKFNETDITVAVGATTSAAATIQPTNATNKNITYAITAGGANASVDAATGVVTGLREGTATLTATTEEGNYKATCTINVIACTPVDGISLEVVSFGTIPEHPVVGDDVTLTAVIRNNSKMRLTQGFGIVFMIDNLEYTATSTTFFWDDEYKGDGTKAGAANAINLSACSTLTATMNGGVSGSTWIADRAGTREVTIRIDDTNWVTTNKALKPDYIGTFTVYDTPAAEVTGVTVTPATAELWVNETATLNATVNGTGDYNTAVTWTSSNPAVATVNAAGTVTAVGEGTATITATSNGDNTKSASATITVKQAKVTGVTIVNKPTETLIIGVDNLTLNANVDTEGDISKAITWTSDNPDIAVNANGVVTASASGTATIRAASAADPGKYDEVTVRYIRGRATSIRFEQTLYIFKVGTTVRVNQVAEGVNPYAGATGDYKIEDKNIAYVDGMSVNNYVIVYGKAAGETEIVLTFKDNEGNNFEARATLRVEDLEVTGVDIENAPATMKAGDTERLTAVVTGDAGVSQEVVWASSNPAVVRVDADGTITAVSDGNAVVTATSAADPTKSASVNIEVSTPKVNSVVINGAPTEELIVGESVTLTATVDAVGLPETVTWTSSNTAVATVNPNGVVTITGAGTVTIRATSTADDTKYAEADIRALSGRIVDAKFAETEYTVKVGAELRIDLDLVGEGTNYVKGTVWEVADETVIGKGETERDYIVITGLKEGQTTLTWYGADARATVGYNFNATTNVRVTPLEVTEVRIENVPTTELHIGDGATLTAVVTGDAGVSQDVVWASSNPAAVTVDAGGNITAVGEGSATITATSAADPTKKATAIVAVGHRGVESLEITNKPTDKFLVGATCTLNVRVVTVGGASDDVEWTSSNPAVATVDANGVVTFVGEGEAVITATAADDPTKTDAATVNAIAPKVESVTITNKPNGSLYVTTDLTLNATVSVVGGLSTNYTWESSNEAVATIAADGKVTILGEGVVTFTARSVADPTKTDETEVEFVNGTVTGVTVNPETATIKVGASVTFAGNVQGAGNYPTAIRWESGDNAIATVDAEGRATGVGAGVVTITAYSDADDTYYATATLTVEALEATGVTIGNVPAGDQTVGESVTLTATVEGDEGVSQNVAWATSDPTIATVDENGKVTFVGEGTVTITATSEVGGLTDEVSLTVIDPRVVSLDITNKPTADIVAGESLTMEADIVVTGGLSEKVTWASSDEAIATVDENGKVTTHAAGTVSITATAEADPTKQDEATLTVVDGVAEAIAVTPRTVAIKIGQTETAAAAVTGQGSPSQEVRWESADPAIATVDENGVITAVSEGSTTITAYVKADETLSATVSVNVLPLEVTAVGINETLGSMLVGETATLTATVEGDTGISQEVTWETGDLTIATIDANGVVTAVGEGATSITATSVADPTKSVSIIVNVVDKAVVSVTIDNAPTDEQKVGESIALIATVTVKGGASDAITWASDDETIATVDGNGNVVFAGEGVVTITATAVEDATKSDAVTMTVIRPRVESLIITNKPTEAVIAGETLKLETEIIVVGGLSEAVRWTITPESVATVGADGTVTAVSEGTATVRATAEADPTIYDEAVVNIINGIAENIAVTPKALTLKVGETATATATISGQGNPSQAVRWASADPTIATINANGVITAVKAGTVTLTATSAEDATLTDELTLTVEALAVSGVQIVNKPAGGLSVGETLTLSAVVAGDAGVSQEVTWTSSNESVAVVSATGAVTIIAAGEATITATSVADETYSDSAVLSANVSVSGVHFDTDITKMPVGQTITLEASVEPGDAANQNVRYEVVSGNATLNGDRLTATGEGDIRVRVISEDGGMTDEMTIEAVNCPQGTFDLVVDNVTWNPENPEVKDNVIFSAVVRNAAFGATPEGDLHEVTFEITDAQGAHVKTLWSDQRYESIEGCESVTFYVTNSSSDGNAWTPVKGGQYTVSVTVNGSDLLGASTGETEVNKANNTVVKTIDVPVVDEPEDPKPTDPEDPENPDNAVNQVTGEEIVITAIGREVSVSGLSRGNIVEVYNVLGAHVLTVRATESTEVFGIDKGIYIVRVAGTDAWKKVLIE